MATALFIICYSIPSIRNPFREDRVHYSSILVTSSEEYGTIAPAHDGGVDGRYANHCSILGHGLPDVGARSVCTKNSGMIGDAIRQGRDVI